MDKRVETWCTENHAVLLQPYVSALRPIRLKCLLCAVDRTERATTLVETPGCPTCPAWSFDDDGWIVERPYDLNGMLFLYGLDIQGMAVVLDASPSDERRSAVEKNGFRYIPVHLGLSVDEVRKMCTHASHVSPLPVRARPRYGWKWVGAGKPYEPDPEEQSVIAWLRTEREAHPELTVHALCALMEKHPEFPRRNAKRWHPTAVQRIMEHNGIPVRPNYYAH